MRLGKEVADGVGIYVDLGPGSSGGVAAGTLGKDGDQQQKQGRLDNNDAGESG